MTKSWIFVSYLFISATLFAQKPEEICWLDVGAYNVQEVSRSNDTLWRKYVSDPQIYRDKWDTLAQPSFWRVVMKTPKEQAILNVAATRQILEVIDLKEWKKQTEPEKEIYKDSIRLAYSLKADSKLYITSGKSHFYNFDRVIPHIDKAIPTFVNEHVDPWYAQAILLIESPNKLQKSPVGAYGSFQLMKSVARQMGLKVTSSVDERKDFNKSATGAARLLRKVCIPHARKILEGKKIYYNENELWFKLLVLHIYHAGAGNVKSAINVINPNKGDQKLITTLWQTSSRGFKNASQNYSQVALASILELNDIITKDCEMICPVFSIAQ